jgi:HEPN domain-containing protein
MSIEKNLYEALRWLRTGEDDLDAASVLRGNKKFFHACFHAQQAGEKALKAVWHYADADPWGHSIRKLITDLENVDLSLYDRLKSLLRAGTMLDRFYIPTRYPNGLPELTPGEAYLDEDAEECIQHATEILTVVKSLLPDNGKDESTHEKATDANPVEG